jgi:polar amino acid transport system substrate-binding protein
MNKVISFCLALIASVFSDAGLANNKSNLKPTKLPPITFYSEDFAPANYVKNDILTGITIDSLKLIWADLNLPEQDITILPWTRGYRGVLKTPNSALLTMAKTPARENLFKWVGPLFNSEHVLMAKKSANLKFNNLGDVLNYRVSTIQGDISEISLQQIGFPDFNMAKVQNLERAFIMLQSDRVDMMMVSIHSFQHLTARLNADVTKYEQVWTVNQVGNYIAFNKQTHDNVIKAYQNALDNVRSEQVLIKQKYDLPLIKHQ